MGCNLSSLKKMKEAAGGEDNNKKVLFLGLDNAGKSTLLFQMKDKQFKETVPTVGLNVEQIIYRGTNFTLWDVSGQATRLWKHYFDKINAVIFVVDTSDRERIVKAKEELHKVLEDPDLATAPVLIYANKQDVEGSLSPSEVISNLGLDDILKGPRKHEICFQLCSAKNGDGVWEGIGKLEDIMSNKVQSETQGNS